VRQHHRGLLKVHLELVAALEQALAEIDATVGKTLAPIRNSARLLTTLPGVSDLTAQVMVIGVEWLKTALVTAAWAKRSSLTGSSAARALLDNAGPGNNTAGYVHGFFATTFPFSHT
jgi:hypothetical protein